MSLFSLFRLFLDGLGWEQGVDVRASAEDRKDDVVLYVKLHVMALAHALASHSQNLSARPKSVVLLWWTA